jgi:hypothetical protein
LREGRVTIWNERANFGVPVLAQGQIGVFYPVHLVLFTAFEPVSAYANSMLLHLLMAGWFAYACARMFELPPWPSALVGIAFSGQGFFLGQLAQPWSWTSGCWLPLAVGMAWRWMIGGPRGWLLFASAQLWALGGGAIFWG